MAGEPFLVSTLNGVAFAPTKSLLVNGGNTTIVGTNDLSIASGQYLSPAEPRTVTQTTDYYRAGFVNGDGQYVLPNFGKFTVTAQYDPIYTATFYINGFGSDGRTLFVTRYPNTTLTQADLTGGVLLSTTPNPSVTFPLTVTSDASTFIPVCFAEGTGILTPDGEVAVEMLSEGDEVVTASGAVRAVKWVGRMVSHSTLHPRPWEVNPVRVRSGAFGEGLPVRDLRLSPGHAVLVEGVLVPVGHLVNGATIVQETVEQIRYYHLELESHDVLVAEGLPCESYLDDGNRASFANAEGLAELHGRLDPRSWDDACAPLVAGGPQLTQIQRMLHARAQALGWVKTEEADLRLVADGEEIAPVHVAGNRYWFAAPASETLALRSNRGVLAQMIPGMADGRTLGVAVGEIRIDGVALALADDAAFGPGFFCAEHHEAHRWRWTDGEASLATPPAAPAMIEIALTMIAPSWQRSTPQLRLVKAA